MTDDRASGVPGALPSDLLAALATVWPVTFERFGASSDRLEAWADALLVASAPAVPPRCTPLEIDIWIAERTATALAGAWLPPRERAQA